MLKKLFESWRKHLNEEEDPSTPNSILAYHGSNQPIKKFDTQFSAQGVLWFTEDKDKLISGNSGAVSSKYIMTVMLKTTKTADWDLYDKLSLSEIEQMGYDAIHLDNDWIIFNPEQIEIIKTERMK